MPSAVSLLQHMPQRLRGGVEIGREIHEHVGRGRAQRAGSGQRRQIPIRHDVALHVMARRKVGAHGRREGDGRLAHAEGREDAAPHELLVAHSCLEGERMPE